MSEHPQYPSPVVIEAICDIVFRTPEWNPDVVGKYYTSVSEKFPIIEASPLPSMTMVLHIGQPDSPPPPTPMLYRYKSTDSSKLIQLTQERLVINLLGNYAGWENFKKEIQYALSNLSPLLPGAEIRRIGLRYVNRFERNGEEALSNWLKPTAYIPQSVLTSQTKFFSQIQVRPSEHSWVNIVITTSDPPQSPAPSFIFDIDCAVEQTALLDVTEIINETETLHESVWNIFSEAKTERLERLLKGEKP